MARNPGASLRSDLVFSAVDRISNRFLLCHTVRLRARMRFHRSEGVISSINRELAACRQGDTGPSVVKPVPVPVDHLLFSTALGE